jgi:hypothetical protein
MESLGGGATVKWPLPHEFNEAIQNPAASFADPDLRAGTIVVSKQGLPLPHSGNFADVYQMVGPDGRNWAVKCFTRAVFGLEGRYAAVSAALARAKLPFGVHFTFLTQGIRVRGEWRPVIKMEWVEGRLLNQVVGESVTRPSILSALAQMWARLCRRLRESGIAHADIQHGNVLLVAGSQLGSYDLKLIDYDGMYLPALAHVPSDEAGHPNFQHPQRAATRTYSADLDRFPHLVVATALKALEVGGQELWNRYDNGDNLLFVENDFRNPDASTLMRELWQCDSPAVRNLVGRLAVACRQPIPNTPWLDQILPGDTPLPIEPDIERAAAVIFEEMPSLVPVESSRPTPREPLPKVSPVRDGFPLPEVERESPRFFVAKPKNYERPPLIASPSRKRTVPSRRTRTSRRRRQFPLVGIIAFLVVMGVAVAAIMTVSRKRHTVSLTAGPPEAAKTNAASEPRGLAKADAVPEASGSLSSKRESPRPEPKVEPEKEQEKEKEPEKKKEKEGPEVIPEGTVFLNELKAFNVTNGPWPVSFGTTGAPDRAAIKVGGQESPRGLGMHPPNAPGFASASFTLPKGAKRFKGSVGLNDNFADVLKPAQFGVFGDNKKLWDVSDVTRKSGLVKFDVDVEGFKALTLATQTPFHAHAHAVWFEPRIEK